MDEPTTRVQDKIVLAKCRCPSTLLGLADINQRTRDSVPVPLCTYRNRSTTAGEGYGAGIGSERINGGYETVCWEAGMDRSRRLDSTYLPLNGSLDQFASMSTARYMKPVPEKS